MEINYSLLQKYNPWWEDKNAIKRDEKIIEFSSQAIKYYPNFFIKEKFTKGVYTLLGPRQVGKSTTFKLFIKNLLLEKKINPLNLLFFQCDAIKDFQELIKVLETYKESLSNKNRFYIFLDEISFIEEWPRAIKHLIDRGDLKNAIIFLAGSLSLNVKGGAELMPGRRGKKEKQDFLLLPLDFKKYVKLLKNESS
ncbi:AAA family ATPase [Patescibacteria group bacterium]